MKSLRIILFAAAISICISACSPSPPHVDFAKRQGDRLIVGVDDYEALDSKYALQDVLLLKGEFKYWQEPRMEPEILARIPLVKMSGELTLANLRLSPKEKYTLVAIDGQEKMSGRPVEISGVLFHGKQYNEKPGRAVASGLIFLLQLLVWVVFPLTVIYAFSQCWKRTLERRALRNNASHLAQEDSMN